MKGTTKVFVAARNVGDASHEGDSFEGTVVEAIRWIARFLAEKTLATRIDIAIGRDAKTVENRILSSRAIRAADDEAMLAEIELAVFGQLDDLTSIPVVDGDTYES